MLPDSQAKLRSSFVSICPRELWTIAMQVLFVLRFYYPDKTDEIDRLPCLESRDGREDE